MDHSLKAVAVIVDISRSRSHPDRRALQNDVVEALSTVNRIVATLQPLEPTVGDEFQGAYADLASALRATLLVRLHLPEGVDCRFGIGAGELRTVGTSAVGSVQDGSAWWSARSAIGDARDHEYSRLGFVRTWFDSAYDDSSLDDSGVDDSGVDDSGADDSNRAGGAHRGWPLPLPAANLVNAYLLCRDHIVGGMQPRSRRLLLGQLLDRTQAELAREEGVSQSAVSQNLSRSGATALLASEGLLLGGVA